MSADSIERIGQAFRRELVVSANEIMASPGLAPGPLLVDERLPFGADGPRGSDAR